APQVEVRRGDLRDVRGVRRPHFLPVYEEGELCGVPAEGEEMPAFLQSVRHGYDGGGAAPVGCHRLPLARGAATQRQLVVPVAVGSSEDVAVPFAAQRVVDIDPDVDGAGSWTEEVRQVHSDLFSAPAGTSGDPGGGERLLLQLDTVHIHHRP